MIASRYGVQTQGATSLALTKLDVLSYLDKIPVCVGYTYKGERLARFPMGVALAEAKPVYEYFDGWKCDISGCRTFDALPENAQKYVKYIEDAVGCPIEYVSVGAERDAYIKMF